MNALTNLKCTLALSAGFCSSFANAQKQPHIILIMTDQQRGDAVGYHAAHRTDRRPAHLPAA